MKRAIVRIFDQFEHAEQAREALLAEGFGADAVQVDIANDEAGAVKGNFSVGNGASQSERHTYQRNYARPHQPGHCIMRVVADDAGAADNAAAILGRFGARDIDALSR
ncbi:MAG: hypothetical protein V4631_16680 [Pseudomonadota bacterium]